MITNKQNECVYVRVWVCDICVMMRVCTISVSCVRECAASVCVYVQVVCECERVGALDMLTIMRVYVFVYHY